MRSGRRTYWTELSTYLGIGQCLVQHHWFSGQVALQRINIKGSAGSLKRKPGITTTILQNAQENNDYSLKNPQQEPFLLRENQ
jgi:hypothetical protein